ncbi:MAG: HAMP domain-containing sensor histidine kinase [Actinomycetes bacterium]
MAIRPRTEKWLTRRSRGHSLGLRARTLVSFGLIAFTTSLLAGVATYSFTRSYLLEQRENAMTTQAFSNARLMGTYIETQKDAVGSLVSYIRTEADGFAVLQVAPNEYFSVDPLAFTQIDLPKDLVAKVQSGKAAVQKFSFNGHLYEAVGTPVSAVGANYFEVFSLRETERIIGFILSAVIAGLVVATSTGLLLGWFASKRLLRPVGRVANTAAQIADGKLDARLLPESDPDLDQLVTSFNAMADAVQERIEREIRFASDVSHELRSPITALTAAIEVLAAKRHELSERNQQAFDIVDTQVRRFDRMVIDLLELSRLESGASQLRVESVDIQDLISRIAQRFQFGSIPIINTSMEHSEILVDRLRIERILVNLLGNAAEHAGGARAIIIHQEESLLTIHVDDNGPGLPDDERLKVFSRFARGRNAARGTGSGLGLAIAMEHAKVMNGNIMIADHPVSGEQGLRFTVTISLAKDAV